MTASSSDHQHDLSRRAGRPKVWYDRHGPGTRRGWNFEPAALVRWKRKTFSPSLEYYGEIPSINVPPRAQPEVHQMFVGGDYEARPGFSINMGLGFDLGSGGPGVVVKSRFEWDWRANPKP